MVGARGDDLNDVTASGSAYVFEWNGTAWTPRLPPLRADDARQGAQFGAAVWLDGDSVLIGAPFDDGNAGAAYLFMRQSDGTNGSDGSWLQQSKFRYGPGGAFAFGQSVAMLGNQFFLGGPEYSSDAVTQAAGAVATCAQPVVQRPILTCGKSGPRSVDAGGLATYRITVANTGDAAAANVMLDDPTPPGLAFVSAGPPCGAGFPCPLGPLGPHAPPVAVAVTFQVPAGCPARGSFTNAAKVTGDGAVPYRCMAPPTAIVGPPPGPVLSCAEQGLGAAKPGDMVTYEVTVGNTGCGAAKDVILSDPTPPGLVLLGVRGGRCTQLPCNLGTIEPGQSLAPVGIDFKLPAGCAPSTVTNAAAVNGSNAARQACPLLVTSVPGGADLGIALGAPPLPAQVMGGDSFKFSSVVSNAGPHTARGVTVDVSIGASAIVDSPVPAGCSAVAGQPNHFTCLLGDLPCGGAAPLDFMLRAPSCSGCAAGAAIDLGVDAHSQTPDPTLPNHASATVQVTCPVPPSLSITMTETPDPVAPGQGVVYDVTVSNAGPGAVSGAVVQDAYPPELRRVLWCRDAPCTPFMSPPLVDTIDLAPGEKRVYRLSGIVRPMCSGVLHNLATVTPPSGVCNNPATQFSLDTPVAATGVHAFCQGFSGQMLPSTPLTKTMLLINCGPANQADDPGDEFTDTLPAGLTLTGASATSGTASTSGNTVRWNGAIPAGGTVTITMTANIDAGTAGMVLCNQATVFYDADGDGINDSIRLSDDPDEPGPADPCCFIVITMIPALSPAGLAALALLLAGLAVLQLRRRRL